MQESAKVSTDTVAYKISQSKDTEQNWIDVKKMFHELGTLAKQIAAKYEPIQKKEMKNKEAGRYPNIKKREEKMEKKSDERER